jgi:6-hydroxycyclohex-1-ene-1-carbonyl-CoA dehydrogenase
MDTIQAYQMTATDAPLARVAMPFPELGENDAVVQVAGCGVCHTDLSFWHAGVPTRHQLPLVLGHEISGTVTHGPVQFKGKKVIVPAVLPCGQCDLCKRGRGNICQKQLMPGNDFHGGFASHAVVPAQYLIPVSESALVEHSLAELAVIADAVSTPYQVIVKSDLQPGDLAIVIGVGGIGIYAAQLANIMGGKVIAIDIAQDKLDQLAQVGVTSTVCAAGLDVKGIKEKVKEHCRKMGGPSHSWKIYECSGTKAGQELAFALLGTAGTLSVVGFTLDKLDLRLSNLMAFDANIIGTWGCRPELYADVIKLVADGRLKLKPFTETRPMSQINTVFQEALAHKISRRAVLIPDF